ncbi:hypothetical protein EVAR_57314_1 [Eumeta japonica]|uniref:Uncharacterized protein n=1 Tax=Eumeta variegata TaxID=151549 RepID=A0A4C1ZLL8_EUMVA|nr:hypothetical protein EVAR_57314_1 [Eumeta japonica]
MGSGSESKARPELKFETELGPKMSVATNVTGIEIKNDTGSEKLPQDRRRRLRGGISGVRAMAARYERLCPWAGARARQRRAAEGLRRNHRRIVIAMCSKVCVWVLPSGFSTSGTSASVRAPSDNPAVLPPDQHCCAGVNYAGQDLELHLQQR